MITGLRLPDMSGRTGAETALRSISANPTRPSRLHDSALPNERRLVAAVLIDAVHCFRKYASARDPHGRRRFAEEHRWIYGGDRTDPFSFENICGVLDINPGYVRRALSDWRRLSATTLPPPSFGAGPKARPNPARTLTRHECDEPKL